MKVNVLISYIGLPSDKIGSWNLMFTRLLVAKPNLFTHIICPKTSNYEDDEKYYFVKPPKINSYKFQKIFKHYRYRNYYKQLKKILSRESEITINIVDNINMLFTIHQLLIKDKNRDKVRIIYHLHGFDIDIHNKVDFYNAIDSLLVLTNTSAIIHKERLSDFNFCQINQIYNGIDSEKFKPVPLSVQKEIKKRLNLDENSIYYLWLSQDREKKGLHVIINAWRDFSKDKPNIRLLVIGTDKDKYQESQVSFLGRIPNNELPKYYQIASFFLFSTLCNEGHPLALTEALISGCYCLSSNIEPLPEILDYGNYGVLVDNPQSSISWINHLEKTYQDYINNGHRFKIPISKYSLKSWLSNMEKLLLE